MKEYTILELQEKMASGELTARSIAEMYLDQISRLDKDGPAINAVMELNPGALEIAQALDEERRSGQVRGPLHGVPVIVKDNFDTADKMMTTAGSLALEGHFASKDSFVVQKLREAGALILGKANLSEWANFRSTTSTSGWSSRGGQTKNPYALDRSPSGSSSGSAVAVGANLCAAAIGTETDGSLVWPAHINGIITIKPTLGLISRSGIIPIAHSQDTAGPMTRTVADTAILLGALTGVDPTDPATIASEGKALSDYTPYLDPNGLKGARIGVARNYFDFNREVDKVMKASIAEMKRLGAVIIDPVDLKDEEELSPTEMEVLLYEFKADLNAYLTTVSPDLPAHSLKEIIAFNEKNQERVMPYFGQERMLLAEEKGPLTEPEYKKALETNHRLARVEGIDAEMIKHQLDAIIAPTGGPSFLRDWVNGDHHKGGSSSFAAVAGYPNITLPAGYIYGLPVGISFFASAYQEPTLIKLAYAFEQGTQVRQPPKFLPSVNFNS
jgi:amidase